MRFLPLIGELIPPLGDAQPSNPPGEDVALIWEELLALCLDFRTPASIVGEATSENDPNRPAPYPPADEGGDSIPPSPSLSPRSPGLGDRFLEGVPPPPISVATRLTSPALGCNVCW